MKAPRIRPARALASVTTLVTALGAASTTFAQPSEDATKAQPAGDSAAAQDTGESAEADASVGLSGALGGRGEADAEGNATSIEPSRHGEVAEPDPERAEPDFEIGVMRLPGSAYPEPKPRGIQGGSLWSTMQGLQWPYMPMRKGSPALMVGVSGFAWVDPSYAKVTTTEDNASDETTWRTQGRFGLRVTPTYSMNEWFVQAQAEFIANSEQVNTNTVEPDDGLDADESEFHAAEPVTDDLWVRVGQWNKWDVQLGRYQGWEVYHFGMGLDLHTFEREGAVLRAGSALPPSIYGVTFGYYRDSVGNLAAHLYPTDFLRFELLGKFGSQSDRNTIGGRPVGIVDLGFIKFKLGGEYIKETETRESDSREFERRGMGAALQGVFAPYLEAGINGAIGLVDALDSQGVVDVEGTYTTYSYGGFANFRVIDRLIVGGGGNLTWFENIHEDANGRVGEFDHLQVFGAVQYALFDQLTLKLVGNYARARFAPTSTPAPPYENTMLSGRLRASVCF